MVKSGLIFGIYVPKKRFPYWEEEWLADVGKIPIKSQKNLNVPLVRAPKYILIQIYPDAPKYLNIHKPNESTAGQWPWKIEMANFTTAVAAATLFYAM